MHVGLMFSHRNPPQFAVPWPRIYAETLEQVTFAEQLGFDSVFSTEHHFTEDGYAPSLMPIEAAWAARTSRVKLGSFVLLLCMQNPLRLAEDAATVDIISDGRLILGMGLGYRGEEFAGFGVPKDRSGRIMDEALEIIVRAWTEDDFSFRGRHFQYEHVTLSPRPVQQPRPQIWVGQAGRPGVRRVAQWGLEGFCGAPNAEVYQHYLAKCQEYGTEPKAQAQTLVFGHVHEDAEKAWAEAEPYATHVHTWYRTWRRGVGDARSFTATPRDDFVIGDPSHWISRLERTIEAQSGGVRPNHLIVQLQLAGMPHDMAMRSMELFAGKVMPHFQTKE
ncbi:MAG: LLM class flavin-dependent oxidoreductase [Chloroflexi bacterium]|nr:LLM class flavin-dependent oxidoreductase [Chloroflexota bacterium]